MTSQNNLETRIASFCAATGSLPAWFPTRAKLLAAEARSQLAWSGETLTHSPVVQGQGKLMLSAGGTFAVRKDAIARALTASECQERGLACGPGNY